MAQWAQGRGGSGSEFSKLVYSEQETGVLRRLSDAQGQPCEALWNALVTAVMYVAWLAYRDGTDAMTEDVAEVDVSTLGLLEEQWRKTSTYEPSLIR